MKAVFLLGLLVLGPIGAVPLRAAADAEAQAPGGWQEPARSAVRSTAYYFVNRALDLADVFKLDASVGRGPGADVRLTRLLQAGFSDYSVLRLGLHGRKSALWREELSEGSVSVLGIVSGENTRDPFEVGATLNFLVLGAEASINVRSIADFVLGIFTIDFEKDDWGQEGPPPAPSVGGPPR